MEKGIDVAMMTVLSLALTETSVPRLPFLPFTLMLPLRNSSCSVGSVGEGRAGLGKGALTSVHCA